MCGRYAITLPPEAVRQWFGYVEQPNFPPRYNIAPTQPIPVVTRDATRIGDPTRRFRLVRWGFVPRFAKLFGEAPLIINARADGVVEKPSFRAAMIRRRCLVIADGYYEWRRPAGRRDGATPFLIRRPDRTPMGLAGLWETWLGADGSEVDTGCIITTDANATMAAIHPRMPAVIPEAAFAPWLDVETCGPAEAATLLRPAPDDALEAVEIGTAVDKVGNDEAAIQAPAEPLSKTAPASRPAIPTQGRLF